MVLPPADSRPSLNRRVLARLVHWALSAGFCGSAGVGTAFANDACTVVSGTHTYQCAGNQSTGITFTGVSSPAGTLPTTATGLNITNLSLDITGTPTIVLSSGNLTGAVVVSIPNNITASWPIIFNGPTHGINLPSALGSAITVSALSQTFASAPTTTLSLVLNGPVTAGGPNQSAISVLSTGETGSHPSSTCDGCKGGPGFFTRDVNVTVGQAVLGSPPFAGSVTMLGAAVSPNTNTPAISLQSIGGSGGAGQNATDTGGGGGPGAPGGTVSLSFGSPWTISGSPAGILLISKGGSGAGGGTGGVGSGGLGGPGGAGSSATLSAAAATPTITITTQAASAPGIQIFSEAGNGGTGGAADTVSSGGKGGAGGWGGSASISGITPVITTRGANSAGLGVFSLGGIGGNGGDGGAFTGSGGSGGSSGVAGNVTLGAFTAEGALANPPLQGTIATFGADSPGVIAQSVAGHGGAAGNAYGFVNFGATGGSAGFSGGVLINANLQVATTSDRSPAISAQSIGGGGGTGGSGFGLFFSQGQNGGNGGNGGDVLVTNFDNLTTSGADSHGIYAQSIGGAGGDGGWAGGLVAVGGKGAAASNAGQVHVSTGGIIITGAPTTATIFPSANPICGVGCSSGIVAQSIGGGGGNGGSTGGWFSIGGSAGGGGNGSIVEVDLGPISNTGQTTSITTNLPQSYGILAQSIGGGGGTGGVAVGAGAWVSAAVGGSGGNGGNADQAIVTVSGVGTAQPSITTKGDKSPGITVQSLGGGGGNGGFAVDAAAGKYVSASLAVGGAGGTGGSASAARFNYSDSGIVNSASCCSFVTTSGASSPGITVQSIGGGGGNGGFAISADASSQGIGGSIAVGGSGGGGGSGYIAQAWSDTTIKTQGDDSPGLQVQSAGGGGGNGGLSVAGTITNSLGFAVAVGGSGGSGGSGGYASAVANSGQITTAGARSDGISAQSIGGGGGRGGLSVAAVLSAGGSNDVAISASIGGSGGIGGSAISVDLTNNATVTVSGSDSRALVAQSHGGGGGNGNVAVAGSASITSGKGVSLGVAVGGKGGIAGDGGSVTVNNNGALQTSSQQNAAVATSSGGQGILAQSIGGGGGTGGWAGTLSAALGSGGSAAFGVGVGGSGGAAGNASTVTVNNAGAITTWNTNSEAILAQSTAGGGGNAGGIANLTLAGVPGSASKAFAGSINVGQDGGTGGKSGTVTVTNTSTLTTNGTNSAAISAQSHGGGGGNAGYLASLTLDNTTQGQGFGFSANVGGSGGGGGSAGTVTVNSYAPLTTFGDSSPGILAQSVGGSGGSANTTVAVDGSLQNPLNTAATTYQGTVIVGGGGGSSSISDVVNVTNTSTITTGKLSSDMVVSGNASHGILALSVGGNGGSAGSTFASSTPNVSYDGTLTLGGAGKAGAAAATVIITNSGAITVNGNSAAGIIARSIGGGGGDSGANSGSFSGSLTEHVSFNPSVSVGITGGGGGSGGPVTVTNTAPISTSPVPSTTAPATIPLGWQAPINSYGIFAQSVGGGGGAGGSSTQLYPSEVLTTNEYTVTGQVNVGGNGGTGAIGGTVTVNNSARITTYQTESYAIAAQSVGGSGGKGGIASTMASALFNAHTEVNIGIAVGGSGGAGNNGNTVTVSNTNNNQDFNVSTSGTSAHAIFAQSVGGGGGDGGSAAAYALGVNPSKTSVQGTANIAVGGSGGSAGSGGAVTVTSASTITTIGDDAIGIFAQSVGGGGGIGGNGSTGTTFPLTSLSVAVGGKGGAAGDGGTVKVNHTDFGLLTSGANAPGIYAQSIGGGGGRGGVGLYTPLFSFPIGGTGGSSGNGGEVDVYVAFGGVKATGTGRGYGIFAQSVGGGGGEAGGTGVGIVDPNSGAPVMSMNSNSGSTTPGSGSGGPVTVTVQKAFVTTSGDDAIGIFAQSVGGGGGVAGQTTTGCTTQPCGYQVGSTGGTGNGGLVTVALQPTSSVGASVTTTGQYSHGIFAQSAAGNTGTAAGVTVNITGGSSVSASGVGASGIFANSAGGGSSGPIQITVDAGSAVSGGTSTASTGAAGIRLVDGHANTITNAGTITSVDGVNGWAIRTDRGNPADFSNVVTTVTNTGTIIGSHQAGTNTTIYINGQPGGTIVTGTQMILGGGTLTNAGVLEIGGAGHLGTTRFEGTLTQTSNGRLVVDLAPFRSGIGPQADRIDVIGRAQLAGKLDVRLADFGEAGHGRQRVTLIDATDGVDFTGLSVTPSAVAQYRLETGSLMLSYEVNFANPLVAPALSGPQLGVASYLEALHVANALPTDFNYLLGIGTAAEYGQSLDRLSPQAYAANIWAAQLAATQFGSTMLECRNRSTNERVLAQGSCFAGGVSGWKFDRDNDGSAGYELSSGQFSIGAERQLSPEWAIGGAIGYDRLRNRGDNGFWSGDANLYHAGVFVRRNFSELALTAAAIGGFSKPDMDRYPTPTTRAHGDQEMHWFGGTLRAEKPFAITHGTLRPMLDVNGLRVKSDGLTESGGLTALQVGSEHQTNWSVRPALEWSMEVARSDGSVLRPRVVVGVTQYLNDPSPALSASFLGIGAGVVAPMQVSSDVSKTYGDVLLGVDFQGKGNLTVGASLFGQFSSRSNQFGGGLQMKMAF